MQSAPVTPQQRTKPVPLPALTGIRTLLSLTILLFHFTPGGLAVPGHPLLSLYPVINIGFTFVGFFFLISGFILAYNYAPPPGEPSRIRVLDFWVARLARLYPVYLLTLLISVPFLLVEYRVRPHADFWLGAVATPLLMQGFFPTLATFWNTVTWTLSSEIILYAIFPWLIARRWPTRTRTLVAMLLGFWTLGIVPHILYLHFNPDHLTAPPDRYSGGWWIAALKYTPFPYVCTFLVGITIGMLQRTLALTANRRALLGTCGLALLWFVTWNPLALPHLGDRLPYIILHGGLLTPVFAMIILGLAGPSWLARIFSLPPLLWIGLSTYCLYLLHFNVFILLQLNHVTEKLHLARFDPWISYIFVIGLAITVRILIETPCQRLIIGWWKKKTVVSGK